MTPWTHAAPGAAGIGHFYPLHSAIDTTTGRLASWPRPARPYTAINLFGRDAVWGGDEGIEDDAEQLKVPHHAFDVVFADECHRGYTTVEESAWRNTLDHFDAVKIGLTATPAAHTKAYFNDVVYRYEYARAVRQGYLVDYDVVTIKSDVRMKGVFLKEGERVSVVDPETGLQKLDELEDQRDFEPPEVEKRVTSPDSNRLSATAHVNKDARHSPQRHMLWWWRGRVCCMSVASSGQAMR